MKNSLLILGLFLSCNATQKTVNLPSETGVEDNTPTVFAQSITEEELKTFLYTYASDEFEGRETGTPGQKKAIEYLKARYETIGVPGANGNGGYYQNVPLEISKLPEGTIAINNKNYQIGTEFVGFIAHQKNYNEIVYVGYGVEDENYSDYTDLDLRGKMVLVKAGEPQAENGTYRVSGTTETSVWSNASEAIGMRLELLIEKGAAGILYYDSDNFSRLKGRFEMMKTQGQDRMALKTPEEENVPYYFIDAAMAKNILPSIVNSDAAKTLTVDISLNLESTNDEISSENVIAYIKGSEKPDEYVVISSHLDHIGVNPNGDINNGADDDGSGTVALLEIAEAFKKAADAGHGPKRSVVFLHVTGEEKGLLGSQYYTDLSPIFPLEQTVANLNIDMIGRIDPKRQGQRNYIYLIGSDKLSTELHELSEEVNNKYSNLELDYTYNDKNDPNRFYYRSDHYNFAKNNIPVIFYFNGTHEDYHKPGDTADKINYDLLENRTRLIFYTAWEIANREKRLVVDKSDE